MPRQLNVTSSVQHAKLTANGSGRRVPSAESQLRLCSAGVRSADGACCAASCGTCPRSSSQHGCSDRPGGRKLCCSAFIRRYAHGCVLPTDVGCVHDVGRQRPFALGNTSLRGTSSSKQKLAHNLTFEQRVHRRLRTLWRNSLVIRPNLTDRVWLASDDTKLSRLRSSATPGSLLAVGLYAPSCIAASVVLSACIGCRTISGRVGDLVRTLAMVDESSPPPFCAPRGSHSAGSAGRVADYAISSSAVLPSGVEAATDLANFPKSIALFGALVVHLWRGCPTPAGTSRSTPTRTST